MTDTADSVYDLLRDDDCARSLITENVGSPDGPGWDWADRDPRRSVVEGMLRGMMLVAREALDLVREEVDVARGDGLTWQTIADALDMPVETVEFIYGEGA